MIEYATMLIELYRRNADFINIIILSVKTLINVVIAELFNEIIPFTT